MPSEVRNARITFFGSNVIITSGWFQLAPLWRIRLIWNFCTRITRISHHCRPISFSQAFCCKWLRVWWLPRWNTPKSISRKSCTANNIWRCSVICPPKENSEPLAPSLTFAIRNRALLSSPTVRNSRSEMRGHNYSSFFACIPGDTFDEQGNLLFKNQSATFIVGAGNFGGKSQPGNDVIQPVPLPNRPADAEVKYATSVDQGALYR